MIKRVCAGLSALLVLSLSACRPKDDTPASSAAPAASGTGSAVTTASTTGTAPETTTAARQEPTASQTKTPLKPTTAATTPAATTTEPRTIKVTIPEGYTLAKTFLLLESKGVASFNDLLKTAETYNFAKDDPLVAQIPSDPNRCYKLEGYLFPSTYEFYKNDKPEDALGRMLRGSKEKYTAAIQNKAKAMGLTMDQIVIIASLIEKEGAKPAEMNNISAVIHNRMQKNWKLELDSTITYLEGAVKGFTDPNKWDAFRNNNNTYKCTGLPATPICNPGMNAIQAALSPTEASYLFFCSDKKTGVYYYADTYEEHQQNEIKAGLRAAS